ncbi:MAG: hypothetical protein ACREOW_11935 [Thermodesulfobacteriota bacterium]
MTDFSGMPMHKLVYKIGKSREIEHLMLDFLDGLSRTVDDRISLGLIPLKLPVVDDAAYRIFETMEEYRRWSAKNLPAYLGYYRPND